MSLSTQLLKEIQKGRTEETHLFSNFEKYYELNDMVKASEFLWGSISKITYLIGLLYGQKLGRHGELIVFLRNLAAAESFPEMGEISAAESLHANFYHNWMSREIFEETVRRVLHLRLWLLETFEKKLEQI